MGNWLCPPPKRPPEEQGTHRFRNRDEAPEVFGGENSLHDGVTGSANFSPPR